MSLNIDAYVAALQSPSITIDGKEYKSKPLSFRNAILLQEQMKLPETQTESGMIAFVERVCELTGLPADILLELPQEVFDKVWKDFLLLIVYGVEVKNQS